MKKIATLFSLAIALSASSCNMEKKTDSKTDAGNAKMDSAAPKKTMDKAEKIISEAIKAHGGALYDDANYGFTFRKKNYTFQNKGGNYVYSATGQKDGNDIIDILENGNLTRTVNGDTVELSPKEVDKYSEALNSVVYFATLPHKLQDAAVEKSFQGRTAIKGQNYDAISVTFDQEGGGKDYSDKFLYWINADTKTMDYLAYNYETNDGGVRFRSAYDPRTVGGIRFQDYINYEAPPGTPLNELPALFEAGELKELSRIETEDVVVLDQ